MYTIRDFLNLPISGLPLTDVIAALDALRTFENFDQLQIVSVSIREDGLMLVKTGGEVGTPVVGGRIAFLRRTDSGWAVEENGLWAT